MRLLGWAFVFLAILAAGFGLGLLAARESWRPWTIDETDEAGA